MVIFNTKLLVYQRVYPCCIPKHLDGYNPQIMMVNPN